jgi:DNA-binding NtrC family response regulator
MDSILIVDDDPGFRRLMETILRGEGYEITSADSVAAAIAACERRQFRLVVTDLRLPDGEGTAILTWLREHSPGVPVLLITAYGSIASAVDAMKQGACDYLAKPLQSPDELRMAVRKALTVEQVEREREVLRAEQDERFSCDSLIADDARMRKVLDLARRVAPTSASILITGESGTGKEVLARCIHRNSQRADRVFVAVNCAALSPTLIESELFGHEKGSFTGAVTQHVGRFERAHGGTLFLDEIAEMDAALQAKLLRVLQEHSFERVGGRREINVDVRVIAATHRNLQEYVASGRFREDLFYRLNRFPIELPPLRERGIDILRLAHFFLRRAAESMKRPAITLSPEAEQVLLRYGWPGNIRELENAMERAVILCDDVVEPDDLGITEEGPVRPVLFRDIERQAILDALDANEGNRTRTAKQLGISLRTLQYRLKEYGFESRAASGE